MSTVFDGIPTSLRREMEMRLAQHAAECRAKMEKEIKDLHDAYGDYNEREFEDQLSEVRFVHGKECLEKEINAWVPVILAHAPDRLEELRSALLNASPCLNMLAPWHLQELKTFSSETFRRVVNECRARVSSRSSTVSFAGPRAR